MKILITGAAGLLGSHLIDFLAKQEGIELILTDIVDIADPSPHTFERLDITDIRAVQDTIVARLPHIVVHLAAFTDVAEAEKWPEERSECGRINIDGTRNIAQAVNLIHEPQHPCYLVYLSTDYVFDGTRHCGSYNESQIANPVNYYAKTKYKGELQAQSQCLGHCLIIRTSFKPKSFKHPKATTDQWTSAMYVDEIVPEIAKAVMNVQVVCPETLYGILHIGGPRVSVFELAQRSNPKVGKITRAEIEGDSGLILPEDTSLDSSRWQEIKQGHGL